MLLLGIWLCWQGSSLGAVSPLCWGGGHREALVRLAPRHKRWVLGQGSAEAGSVKLSIAPQVPCGHRPIDPCQSPLCTCHDCTQHPPPRQGRRDKTDPVLSAGHVTCCQTGSKVCILEGTLGPAPRQAVGWRVDPRVGRIVRLAAFAVMGGAGAMETPSLTAGRQLGFQRLWHRRPRGCDRSATPSMGVCSTMTCPCLQEHQDVLGKKQSLKTSSGFGFCPAESRVWSRSPQGALPPAFAQAFCSEQHYASICTSSSFAPWIWPTWAKHLCSGDECFLRHGLERRLNGYH